MKGPRGWIFDLEGTLYRSDAPIPGATDAVERLRASGAAVRFLTNTTSRGRAGLVARLAEVGFEADPAEVFCPSVAAARWLRARRASARLLLADAARADFGGVPERSPPDFVVLGDLGDGWSGARLDRAFREIQQQGAGLIGLARSRFWLAADGLRLDVGPYVAALEYASGVRARIFGKPEPAIFRAVLEDLQMEPSEVVMVGDDPVTDADAAGAVGLRTVLVRTGKFDGSTRGTDSRTTVVDSVAELA